MFEKCETRIYFNNIIDQKILLGWEKTRNYKKLKFWIKNLKHKEIKKNRNGKSNKPKNQIFYFSFDFSFNLG